MSQANRSTGTYTRREDAKSRWYESDTAKASSIRTLQQFTIKFEYGTLLLAAVAASDIDETNRLLRDGADPNYANIDGLTSLHQACIDENFAMVKLLVDKGANIDACDNEGWTPLHAAASSGSLEIIKFLVNKGANIVAVNSEGKLPIDLTEEEDVEKYLENESQRKGIDMDEARDLEERAMLDDANKWKKEGKIKDLVDPQGATPLHVAAAKGYIEVARILLSLGADANSSDYDGWTPLHAAAYWKEKEMCQELVANGGNLTALNKNGQTPIDLADDKMVEYLKQLAIKYRVNLTSPRTPSKSESPKKTSKEVIGILKTAKKGGNKKSDLPKPLLPPTPKISKPEPISDVKPTSKIPTPSTISTPISTPTKPPTAKAEIAKPASVIEKPKATAISKPPSESPKTPTISHPPKSKKLEELSTEDLKKRILELEDEVKTLRGENTTLSKTIEQLESKLKSTNISKSPSNPSSSIALPKIAKPPGK